MILSLFIAVKSIQMIFGFNLKRMKKITRCRCSTKISKTNLKTMISPLLTRPEVCQGCQKIRKTKLKFGSLRFSPNWIKFEKPSGFLWQFLFNFDSFSQFLQFWLNLSTLTHQSGLQFGLLDFVDRSIRSIHSYRNKTFNFQRLECFWT